jgi:Spy/CpxP family protein refolding chaperone
MAPGRPAPGRDPTGGAAAPLARVLGGLELTEQQRTEIEKVVDGYATKMREVMEKTRSGQLDRGELRDTIAKMAETAAADLKRALTPEQRRRFEQLVPPGRQLFPTPFGPEAGETPPRRPGAETPERPRPPRPNPDGER